MIAGLPIVSYSLFTIDTFFIAYALGLYILVCDVTNKKQISAWSYVLPVFICEVALIYPVASALHASLIQRDFKRAIRTVTLPLVFIIIWLTLEYYFYKGQVQFQLHQLTDVGKRLSLLTMTNTFGGYLIVFNEKFVTPLLAISVSIGLSLFTRQARQNLMLFKSHLLHLFLTLLLALLLVTGFFFCYSSYHHKDLLGPVLIIFFCILVFTLKIASNTKAAISFLSVILALNLFQWTKGFTNEIDYYYPTAIYRSTRLSQDILSSIRFFHRIDKHDIFATHKLSRLLLLKDIMIFYPWKKWKISEFPPYLLIPFTLENIKMLNSLNESGVSYCEMHIFDISSGVLINDMPTEDCKLSVMALAPRHESILIRRLALIKF